MKARIRARLEERQLALSGRVVEMPNGSAVQTAGEEYFTPLQVAARLKLHPDTIKALFRNETNGVIRIGNRISTQYKKRYVIERYSLSAVERLIRRLEFVDPRYSNL